jgi:UDP-glucose 4-epimerase
VDVFIEHGWDAAVVDNLSSGKAENMNSAAELTKLDICDPEIKDFIGGLKPDVVVHTAAQISVSRSVREPAFDAAQNIAGPLDMAMACVKAGVKKFIFSSSGGTVYGEVPDGSATEEHVFDPLSPYGISKMAFEYYLSFFHREYGMDYTTLRYGNVYGPRQDPHGEAGVAAIFTKAVLSGKTPTINGDGKYYRDYVFVKDVARANFLAVDKGRNRAYNVGTAKATDVNEIFRLIAEATGFDKPANYGPPRPGDLIRSSLDYSRAAAELGWRPEVSLEEGMRETVEFFKSQARS